jgi:hypothetical protein
VVFLEDIFKERGPMMKLKIFSLVLGASLMMLSGCAVLLIGSVGAVGGYAITRDTIQGEYDASPKKAWTAAHEVCRLLGSVAAKDSGRGTVEAFVDRAKVKVEITSLTPEAIRVKVKARKGIFPRLGTAEKVFVKIAQQLMEK